MSTLKPLDRRDYRAIFALSNKVEPYRQYNYFDQFCAVLNNRRGFTAWNGDKLVALLSYSDFIPGSSVTIHFTQEPGCLDMAIVRKAFRFPFNDLYVPRLVSYSVVGITDEAGKFLKRLGFRPEGTCKEAAQLPDGPRDVELFGMLRSECRWL